jgi:hypothetical protein
MSITFKLPSPQQHERLFLEDVVQRYRLKLISAADYILSITSIYRPKGQKLNIPSAKSFYEQFGIPKSTFYRAINLLENLPELGFRWEPNGGISMWREPENSAAPVIPEKEPTYTKLKDLPAGMRNEFEIFVRREYQKTKGQKIISFYRFMEDQKDFQNWLTQFQQYKIAATATATATESESEASKRAFSPIPEKLKGLFGKKPT